MKSRRLMPANMAEAGSPGFAPTFRTSADILDFCLDRDATSAVADAGDPQSFDKSIHEARIVAEEKLLSRGLRAVVRLALL
jgi:hypothetical protein